MHAGLFSLGTLLVVFGFVSDIANYHDTYALYVIIVGFALMFIGAVMPSVTTEVRSTKEVKEITPEKRTKTVVTED